MSKNKFQKLIDYFTANQKGLIQPPMLLSAVKKPNSQVIQRIYNQTMAANTYAASVKNIYYPNLSNEGYCFSPDTQRTDFTGQFGQQVFYFYIHSLNLTYPLPQYEFEEHPPFRIFKTQNPIPDFNIRHLPTKEEFPIEIKTAFESKLQILSIKEADFKKHKNKGEKNYVFIRVFGDSKNWKSLSFTIYAAPLDYIENHGRLFQWLNNRKTLYRIIDFSELEANLINL